MKTIGFLERLTWIVFAILSLFLATKYLLFIIVLFVLRFKLTYRDINLVKESLSSFIYSPTSGVIKSIKSDEDFFYVKVTLFPIVGDLVLSPGKFKIKESNALKSNDGDVKLTLCKEEAIDTFELEITPFLRNSPLKTNLLENDIIDEDSTITQSFFGGVLNLKFSKQYDLKVGRGDVIWCSRTIIAGR